MLTHNHKILIAGAGGMVGQALTRTLKQKGYDNLLLPSSQQLDYREATSVRGYLTEHRPDVIVIAAARVGGIYANMTYPASFIYDNLMIASNLIHEAHCLDINRILFLGSSCIYPKHATQPIVEEALLTAPLEPTNEAYALAKIAGIKLCQSYRKQYGRSYIAAMPTNLYGPNDNYHPQNAHVIPALIRRLHEAKEQNLEQVEIWGTGRALREFLYVEDVAEACLLLLQKYDEAPPINIGSTDEVSIAQLAQLITEVVGFKGKLIYDQTKPDGTPRKKLDISKIGLLGWQPKVSLKEGLRAAYSDFLVAVRV